jgi:nicotinamide-nucleotide amidase
MRVELVEEAVGRLLIARGWTLAVAESVTGGGLGARLVRVAGASAWFRGGLTVYAAEAKVLLAGLDPALLDARGPIDPEVARALAASARERLRADVGLAVVGVAGPAGQGGRPVGTVLVASVLPAVAQGLGDDVAERVLAAHGRIEVQERAATMALDHLCGRLGRVV